MFVIYNFLLVSWVTKSEELIAGVIKSLWNLSPIFLLIMNDEFLQQNLWTWDQDHLSTKTAGHYPNELGGIRPS